MKTGMAALIAMLAMLYGGDRARAEDQWDPDVAAVDLARDFGLGEIRPPVTVRIFTVDAFNNDQPAQVYSVDAAGNARLDIYSSPGKPGDAAALTTMLDAKGRRGLERFRRAVLGSDRESPPEPPFDRAHPEKFVACTDAWAALVEVIGPDGVVRRVRNACQSDGLTALLFPFITSAVDYFPACAALSRDRFPTPGRRLGACAMLRGDRGSAAAVMDRFDSFRTLPWSGRPMAGGEDFFAPGAVIEWAGEAPASGAEAIAAAWSRIGRDAYLNVNRITGEADGRVHLVGAMELERGEARFTQDWKLDRGAWRVMSWTFDAIVPSSR